MATDDKTKTYRDLLASGMSRQDIRKQIIGQRKGTFERAAERKAAEKVRQQDFSTIQQAKQFFGNVPQKVLRRTAGFKAVQQNYDKQVATTKTLLEKAEEQQAQEIQRLNEKLQRARIKDQDDRVDRYEDEIREKQTYWSNYKSGLKEGQAELEKGKIIKAEKIRSFAQEKGNVAERNLSARNRASRQRAEAKRSFRDSFKEQTGVSYKDFSTRFSAGAQADVLTQAKMKEGDLTKEQAQEKLVEEGILKFEKIEPTEQEAVTQQVKTAKVSFKESQLAKDIGVGTRVTPFGESIITKDIKTTPTLRKNGFGLLTGLSISDGVDVDSKQYNESGSSTGLSGFISRFKKGAKDYIKKEEFKEPTFGTVSAGELALRLEPQTEPTGKLSTEDFRRIRTTRKTSEQALGKREELIEKIDNIDKDIEEFTKGKVDEATNTWTGTTQDFEKYKQLATKREAEVEKVRREEERFRSVGGEITEEGEVIEPTITAGFGSFSKEVPVTQLTGSDITMTTAAGFEISAGIGKEVGGRIGQKLGEAKLFLGKEVFGLEGGEALATLPEYEAEIFEPQFGTTQIDPITGKTITGKKDITIPEKQIFEISGDEPEVYRKRGEVVGEFVGYAAPFVAAGAVGGKVAAVLGGGKLGVGLGAAAGETLLYSGLRGEEFEELTSEKGIKAGSSEFYDKYTLEVLGLGAAYAFPLAGAFTRGTKKLFKIGRASKYLDEDLGKIYNVRALTDEAVEMAPFKRPTIKMSQLMEGDELIKSVSKSLKQKGSVKVRTSQPTGEFAGDVFELRRTGLFKKEIIKGKVRIGRSGEIEEIFDLGDGLKKITTLELGGKKGISRLYQGDELIDYTKLKGGAGTQKPLKFEENIKNIEKEMVSPKGLQRQKLVLREGDQVFELKNLKQRIPKTGEKVVGKGKIKTTKGFDPATGRFEISREFTGFGERIKVGEVADEIVKSVDGRSVALSKRQVPKIQTGIDDTSDLFLRQRISENELLRASSKKLAKTRPRIDRNIKQLYDEEFILGKIDPKARGIKEARKFQEVALKRSNKQYKDIFENLKVAQRKQNFAEITEAISTKGKGISASSKKLIQEVSEELKDVADTVFIEPTQKFLKKVRKVKKPDVSFDLKRVSETSQKAIASQQLGTAALIGTEIDSLSKTKQIQRVKQQQLQEPTLKQLELQETTQLQQQRQQSRQRQIAKPIFDIATITEITTPRMPKLTPTITPPPRPRPTPPIIPFRFPKAKPRKQPKKQKDEFLESELLPQGFTSAQFSGRQRRKITEAQARKLARSPGRALGIRGAYEIVGSKKPTPRRTTKKKPKAKKKQKLKNNKNYELTGLTFEIPK